VGSKGSPYVNFVQTKEERRTKYSLVKHYTKSVHLARALRDWEPWNIRKVIVNYNKLELARILIMEECENE